MAVLIFFDFRKAFDFINYLVILKRMRLMNSSDKVIRWFYFYLFGSAQAITELKGVPTKFLNLTLGITQDSNCGPVTFLVFVNLTIQATYTIPIPVCFSPWLSDIPTIQVNLPDCISRLSQGASRVAKWARNNGIELNAEKSPIIFFDSLQNLMRVDQDFLFQITINVTVIPFIKSAKNLGVKLINDLSRNEHLSFVCFRVHGVLNRLRFRSYFLSLKNNRCQR